MLTMKVIGVETVAADFRRIRGNVMGRFADAVYDCGLMLQRYVILKKLRGQVLKRRTGRLAESIVLDPTSHAQVSGGKVSIRVGTNLPYGIAHELGANLPAVTITPRFKKALMWKGAKHPVRQVTIPARTMKARPYLRPALAELRPKIRARLEAALKPKP